MPRKWMPGEVDDDAHWAAVDRLAVVVSDDVTAVERARRATSSRALRPMVIGLVECVGHVPGMARIQVIDPDTLNDMHRPVLRRTEVPRGHVHLLGWDRP
jgi:hypothetical protein